MVGSGTDDAAGQTEPDSGLALLAEHDGALALLDAILRLDPDRSYSKADLGESADVAYKTLYLAGTVEALAEIGLLEKDDTAGEEATFSVRTESAIYEAATTFDEAVARRQQIDSGRTNC